MKREIKFSLVFRDMWQSAGKYVPTVDQLTRVAPAIIEMGCFARVETNGGGFEQVNLLFGENPNKAVREWTKPFHAAGIQTHMLDRALNGLRMSPVPDDVRQLFYKVKKAQGTDIARTFCGLNDVRNIAPSIKYAKEAGMISQCSLCITHSPVHTVEYYTKMAFELIELGADEICIKDMANLLLPMPAYNLVKRLKAEINVPIHLHTHNTTGTGDMTLLMAAFAGVDIVDTALSPLGNGTSQPATESLVATLKGTEYDTGLDLEKLSEADGFLDPKVLSVDTNTLIYQVPGGMLSNLISQLKQANAEDKYYDVLAEVPRVRKDFGYPPLVTPTSQIVGSQAVLNVLAGERYKMFTKESKAVLRGEYGRLPGKVNEAVRKKAIGNDKVITCRPADLLKPELDTYRKELGDLAQSEEDVLSYALFPQVAKKFFEARRDGTVPSGADKTVSPAPASAKPAASSASRPTQREVLVVEDLTEDTPL